MAETSPLDEPRRGIWLEVSEVRVETSADAERSICSVLLKADRGQPRAVWWPVTSRATGKENGYETYRAILHELDKKRVVLALLTHVGIGTDNLECAAFRFQSPETLGNR